MIPRPFADVRRVLCGQRVHPHHVTWWRLPSNSMVTCDSFSLSRSCPLLIIHIACMTIPTWRKKKKIDTACLFCVAGSDWWANDKSLLEDFGLKHEIDETREAERYHARRNKFERFRVFLAKKNPQSDELFLDRFFNYLHDSNSIFRAAGIN